MNKKQQQSADTSKKIAGAARQLFIQQGYAATSIEHIADAAGCSKGNIYHHFKSKADLFIYLLDDWNEEWLAEWKNSEPRYSTVTEKLYGVAEHLVRSDLNHPLMKAADEFFGENWVNHDIQQKISRVVAEHIEFNERLLEAGVESGEFLAQDVRQMGRIMESLWMGLSEISRYQQLGLQEALQLYHNAVTVLLRGIARQEG